MCVQEAARDGGTKGQLRTGCVSEPVLEASALEMRPGDAELQQPLMMLPLLPHHYRGSPECIVDQFDFNSK